ncbi:MAG: hypothetical protein L0228_22115 [Planctomycetes bacterium]|nr:hypothetical protein [Planctomycetota bacterium]
MPTGVVAAAFAAHSDAPSAGDDALFERLDADGNGTISIAEAPSDQEQLFARLVRKADVNGDRSLSRDEFIAALVPTRPEKRIEEKQPDGYPQANAVRYLLLTMDTSRDSSIESDEVPDDFQPVFEIMAERVDTNKNGTLDRYELSRAARELGQISARYVARERIDVARELKKLEKSQGKVARRFDEPPGPFLANLSNPRKARSVFTQFDANKDGKLELSEMPEPLQPQLQRFVRFADRDRDGGLSDREFLAAAERISRLMPGQRPKSESNGDSTAELRARRRAKAPPDEAMPAESMPADEQ